MSVVLMYHALFTDDETSGISAEDRPYAVSRTQFAHQLDALCDKKVGLINSSMSDLPDIVVTFDDGHASNLSIAAPMLEERNLSAYFFITSGYIDNRAGFMSSSELRELGQVSGMCIGSHGVSHRYFDDLSESDARAELEQSRRVLTEQTGSATCSFSFPGGRYNQKSISLAQAAGYRQLFGSDINTIDASAFNLSIDPEPHDKWSLQQQSSHQPIERIAIRRNTQIDEYIRIVDQDPAYFRRKKRQSRVKATIRRALGNRLYHGIYKSISAK